MANYHGYEIGQPGERNIGSSLSLAGARAAARSLAKKTGRPAFICHAHTGRREYYRPDGTRIDEPERELVLERQVERASDLIDDGYGLRARGGLVYFG